MKQYCAKSDKGDIIFVPEQEFTNDIVSLIQNGELVSSVRKVDYGDSISAQYLFEAEVKHIDYDYALRYMSQFWAFGCSVFRHNNFIGRSFDFYYNHSADFVVRTHPAFKQYASIGIADSNTFLTKDFVLSGKWSLGDLQPYKLLPFALTDGINEKGLFAEINVVPSDEPGFPHTTGTNPEASVTLSSSMLVRYILDHFKSVAEVIDPANPDSIYNVNIISPKTGTLHYDYHFLIADATSTKVIEFVNNKIVVLDADVMTNFHLTGTSLDENGHIDFASVEPHGQGLERFNLIKDSLDSVASEEAALQLLESIKYSNAYTLTENVWKTEFCGVYPKYGDLKVTDDISKFAEILEVARQKFAERTREDGQLWHSVHSTVYDLNTKSLIIVNQEDFEHPRTFKLNSITGSSSLELWEEGSGEHSVQTKGTNCKANADYSVAEGYNSWAIKDQATGKEGKFAHAEGYMTTALGAASHTEGNNTVTNNEAEHAEGRGNVSHTNSTLFGSGGNTLHSIGIGSDSDVEQRKNAFEVMQNGDVYILGLGDYDGTNAGEEGVLPIQQIVN